MIGRPTRRFMRGRLDHSKVRVRLGGLPGGSGGVGRPTRRFGRVRKAHPEVWAGSRGPPRESRGVGLGWEVLPVVCNVTAGPSEGSVGIGRPTRRFGRGCKVYLEGGRGQEAHPEVCGGLGGPTASPGLVGSPSRRSGRGRECIPEVWVALWTLPVPSGGPLDPYRPLPDLQLGFLSSLDPSGAFSDPPGPLDGLPDPT